MTALDILHCGVARGSVLKLSEPLSFWGGFDPTDGRILDVAHPQAGQSISDKILVLPGSRGSAGTPAGIAEALRLGVGPAAILLLKPDVNITIGAQVAARLYGLAIPVVTMTTSDFSELETGQNVQVSDGMIERSGS